MSEQWEIVARRICKSRAEAEDDMHWLGNGWKFEVHLLPDAPPPSSPSPEEIAEVL